MNEFGEVLQSTKGAKSGLLGVCIGVGPGVNEKGGERGVEETLERGVEEAGVAEILKTRGMRAGGKRLQLFRRWGKPRVGLW